MTALSAAGRRPLHPLAQARAKSDLSREALAALAGLSARTIYAIELGAVKPQRATVRVLCSALGCEPSSIGLSRADESIP